MASETGLKVYGIAMSPAVRIVIYTLYEKDADDFELVRLNLMTGDHKKPEFLAVNPFGKLPAFRDDDLVMFESRAIVRYLATKFDGQGTPLMGTTLKEKALVENWIEVESQNFNGPCKTLNAQLVFNKKMMNKGPDEAIVAANLEKLEEVLDIYEARLSKTPYLAGDFFSLADLTLHINKTLMLRTSGWKSPVKGLAQCVGSCHGSSREEKTRLKRQLNQAISLDSSAIANAGYEGFCLVLYAHSGKYKGILNRI